MTMVQTALATDVVDAAKRGDAAAIAHLISSHLDTKDITVKAAWKDGGLSILLESDPVPMQADMMAFLRHGFANLNSDVIHAVRVYGRRIGDSVPLWRQELLLNPTNISIAAWLNQGLAIADPSLAHPLGAAPPAPEATRFLRLRLQDEDMALLPLVAVQEVLTIPAAEVLPIPHMPDHVLGVYNRRGEILWLVNLPYQLGFSDRRNAGSGNAGAEKPPGAPLLFSALFSQPNPTTNGENPIENPLIAATTPASLAAIAITTGRRSLGLVVPAVFDIERYPPDQVHLPSRALFPASLFPFVAGYIAHSRRIVLDVNALLND